MSDPAAALQRRIHAGIPLSRAMDYRITALSDMRITVEAPLAPNVNVHGSAFAGSLYALGILSAWAMCAHLIERAALEADLVVAAATIKYRAPVHGDIRGECQVEPRDAAAFVGALAEAGTARLALRVDLGAGPGAVLDAQMHARRRPAG